MTMVVVTSSMMAGPLMVAPGRPRGGFGCSLRERRRRGIPTLQLGQAGEGGGIGGDVGVFGVGAPPEGGQFVVIDPHHPIQSGRRTARPVILAP